MNSSGFIKMNQNRNFRHWNTLNIKILWSCPQNPTKPELRYCAGSNPVCDVSEIRDGEDLWQWFWLEIWLNAFRWSTIPQKQFISCFNLLHPLWVLRSFCGTTLCEDVTCSELNDKLTFKGLLGFKKGFRLPRESIWWNTFFFYKKVWQLFETVVMSWSFDNL